MQPGTPHFVISTEDCLAVGGHFYSAPTLDKTMMAMVFEHYVGHLTTNTAHSKCGIVFIRMLSYVHYAYRNFNVDTIGSEDEDNVWMPSTLEVAHLVVIVSYLDQLDPTVFEDFTEGDLQTDSEDEGVETKDERCKRKKKAAARKAKLLRKGEDVEFVSLDNKRKTITVNAHNTDETWQKTEEFAHDFAFAVDTLVPEFINTLCENEPTSPLNDIITVERTLLEYSENFHKQYKNSADDDDEIPLPLTPSEKLASVLEAARKKYKSPSPEPRKIVPDYVDDEFKFDFKKEMNMVKGKEESAAKRKITAQAGPSKVKRTK